MKKYPVFLLYCLICAAAFGGANGDGTVRFTGESFKRHMQGLAAAADRIYWSHTDRLAVTDTAGSYIKLVEADHHHGDICINGGKLYAAVNKGKFNRESGAENFVYVYDLDLNLLEVVPIDFMPQGLGAIEFSDGSFYLGGGALKDAKLSKSTSVQRISNSKRFLRFRRTIPSSGCRRYAAAADFSGSDAICVPERNSFGSSTKISGFSGVSTILRLSEYRECPRNRTG